MIIAKLANDGRQAELIDAGHGGRDGAKRRADARLLAKYVDPEAAAFGDVALEFRVAQVAEFDGHEIAVHSHHGRHTDRQMQIGAALCHREFEECVDSCHDGQGYP